MKIGKISKQKLYTAEELLKKNPLKGRLKREIDAIEQTFKKQHTEKPTVQQDKEVTAKTIVKQLETLNGVSSYFKNNKYSIKHKYNGNHVVCIIADRKHWVSVSMWSKGGKDCKTERIRTKAEMNAIIKAIKEHIKEER